jgi:hypothetical protein
MTTLEIISLVARIKIGTRVQAGNSIIRITDIKKDCFVGINEYAEKKGYTQEKCFISFSNFNNHHYNKNYKIID